MVTCLERGADLHMAQLMPLPLTASCFRKIQIGFTFLVLAHPGSPGQRAVKRVCVCVCVFWLSHCGKASHHINIILYYREMQKGHGISNSITTHFDQKFKLLCSSFGRQTTVHDGLLHPHLRHCSSSASAGWQVTPYNST